MDLKDARADVIAVGKQLLYSGLIVRTWGNVSARVDDNHFVITPSGRDYETLLPEEIVIMNISDAQSWGDILPSSENGMHLACYRDCEDIDFIIHTHQTEASVLSAYESDLAVAAEGTIFSESIPCADYGFPGSDALRDHVAGAFDGGRHRIVLMAHHGAVCMGNGAETTLRYAAGLEMISSYYIRRAFESYVGRRLTMADSPYALILRDQGIDLPEPENAPDLLSSEKQGSDVIFHLPDGSAVLLSDALAEDEVSDTMRLHLTVYEARPDIGAIRHCKTPSVFAFSFLDDPLRSYLDDFAQINGSFMAQSEGKNTDVAEALADHHGVFIHGCGAFCCGKNMNDAEAHAIVAEKNARIRLLAPIFPDKPLNPLADEDIEAMREFYLKKYSARFEAKV